MIAPEVIEAELLALRTYWTVNSADTDGQVAWANAAIYALRWTLGREAGRPTDRLAASVRQHGDGLDGAETLDGQDW